MPPSRRPDAGRAATASALLAALALALTGACWTALAASARAEACAGVGSAPCPYSSAQIISQRAEGVLRFPEAVAVDAAGDVYVGDQLSYTVQKFSATGAFESEWGSFGGGRGQFGPIGGLATDAAGNVYVVDSSHDRIEKFDANGGFITQWGHKGSAPGQFSFGTSQNYETPPGGAVAVSGSYVYVADSRNNRIQRFNLEGGEGIEWGSPGSGGGQFSYPRGLAASATEVLVADDKNHRIQKFDPNGVYQGSVGSHGAGAGQFAFPFGVALDAAGNAYVADDLNHRVVKLTPALAFAGAWGGFGEKPGQLKFPRAIASDPAGDTYVANTADDRIEVFDARGRFVRTIGLSARGPNELTAPSGLASDPTGRLLVADTDGNRVELYAPASNLYEGAWIATGGERAAFYRPTGIGIDPHGLVYVGDNGGNRVAQLWGDGTYLSEIGGPSDRGGAQLHGVGAIALAPLSGRTYVADSLHNRVLAYGADGSLIARWGAEGANGASSKAADGFADPTGVAIGTPAQGEDVYIADRGNNRIVERGQNGDVLRIWGGRGHGDGRFVAPAGVAVDAANQVFVLDRENNRVQVFDGSGHFLAKWGLRGTGLGEFSQPAAIAVDCSGDVYVADTNNNRVERFNPVQANASGCLAPGTWPPPLDVAPVLSVSPAARGGVLARRAVTVSVGCQRGCKVLVSGTVAAADGAGAVALVAAARTLPRATSERLTLRLGPRGLRQLRKALGHRSAITARVRVVAAGPTGRRATVNRIYSLRR
jgi:tripartite motif-containing protein 71